VTIELDGYVADAARSVVVAPGDKIAHELVACAASR
jgi:methionine aminopeptidase